MRLGEQFAAVLLIAFLLFMGLAPWPFVDRISETVRNLPGITS
jgi:NADH:ubiquinone oxidoreductase subunit 4 (subunit M)